MALTIKKASEKEVTEIYEMAGENRREATGHVSDDNQQKMIETYEHSAQFGAYFLCLMDDNTLLGWIMIDKSFDYLTGDEIGWINDVYVKSANRGKGYSKMLMEEALKELKRNGYHDVRLNVYVHNEKAIRLYEAIGFRDVNKFMKINI